MAQYKTGTVNVTNGSAVVTGDTTTFVTNAVAAGDIFTVVGDNAWYEIASVDSETQITLTANYAGTTATGASYTITRDFTTNYGLPYPNKGDIETASLIKRALEEVDTTLATVDGKADTNATDIQTNASDIATLNTAAERIPGFGDIGDLEAPLVRLPLKNSLAGDLAGSVTFTRASTGTYIDRYGKLRYAAVDEARFEKDGLLIEGASTNKLLNSNQFADSGWGKFNIRVVPNAEVAPDGSRTAVRLVEDATTSEKYVERTVTGSSGAGTWTHSFYAKAGTRYRGYIRPVHFGETQQSTSIAFDLSAGTIGAPSGLVTSTSIAAVGNGWYRISATFTTTAAMTSQNVRVHVAADDYTKSYLGDNQSGFYVWGAQAEELQFPSSYIPSAETFTSRAASGTYWDSNGVLQTAGVDVERISYNPADLSAPPAQLLELAATNTLLYSEQLDDPTWSKTPSVTVTANTTAAPDGNTTADTLTDDGSQAFSRVYQGIAGAVAGPRTLSAFVKQGTTTGFSLVFYNATTPVTIHVANFDWVAGVPVGSEPAPYAGNGSFGVQDVGNGWFRVWATIPTHADNITLQPSVYASKWNVTESGTLVVWGVQLEDGYGPTSYIPTTTAAATRAADVWSSAQSTRAGDVCYLNFAENHPALPNGTEFTYLVDFDTADVVAGERLVLDAGYAQAGTNKYSFIRINNNSNVCNFYRGSTAVQISIGGFDVGLRCGVRLKADSTVDTYADGVLNLSTSANLASYTGVNQDSIGIGCKAGGGSALFGHIRNLRIYDFALSDAQMKFA